ncbi:hypothetical protein [Streptomyces sp. NPDC047968]|uniref:hypothetical protein n=1 Tax=unclassified Streptomyces TaxID=2593676 RepID=UPI00343C0FE0
MTSLPPRRRGVTPFATALYRSPSCRIGTHLTCTTSSATVAPSDLPVVFETCDCTCHPVAGGSAQTKENR